MNKTLSLLLLAIVPALPGTAAAETLMLCYPDVHGERIVFTDAGNLWTASTDGGQAR